MRRLVRASLGTGGEAIERTFRARVHVPRKLVVLCDVSGSMEAYSRALVLFLHALVGSGRGVEAFAFGTRLTRLTPDLSVRDPERALRAAAERVVDWSGGTRIGASLKAFNDEWGRRALTRGAVVVIVSDGWEREDAAIVGREMARLRGRRTPSSGSIRSRVIPTTSRSPAACARHCRTSTASSPGTIWRVSKSSQPF